MSKEVEFTVGGDNLYADLGFAEPELELAKAKLARQISALIRARGLNQKQAAAILGLDQPGVSRLMRGRLGVYSTERLMQLLTRLDVDVEISVVAKEPSRPTGRITVKDSTETRNEPVAAAPGNAKRSGMQFS
jgi:predicted XRE-type DNA-binding protein